MNRKIAYITDIHLDEKFPLDAGVDTRKNWKEILKDISSRGINEIIYGGDIGEKSANKWFFESLQDFSLSITLGNHDYYDEVIKHYSLGVVEKRSELYYSQERDHYKCIFLDSSSGSISQEQFDWFRKELMTDQSIVIFIHHPILAVDAEVDNRFALKERNRIKTELLNVRNDVTIFCGHYHFEDERRSGNIRQYITPAGSYQIQKLPNEIKVSNDTFGYRIIELNNKNINTDLIMFKPSHQTLSTIQ
ncbi:metallophosphoesterase [Fulvivirga sp. RKSG066]|uniref:metallophosphoesterase family protein n=1 Tax=Fulvivirga aurantia TaxID=2529383 RepID=UPI0012BC1D0A|nr:metallophosphoesterase [Fulvivirga aurantia]MTI20049.1 metallophosphoesterase [Fulvivirga aurantia]